MSSDGLSLLPESSSIRGKGKVTYAEPSSHLEKMQLRVQRSQGSQNLQGKILDRRELHRERQSQFPLVFSVRKLPKAIKEPPRVREQYLELHRAQDSACFQNIRKGKESEVAQLCLTLCDPMDHNLPGSSVHGILQARVLEWGAIAF